MKKNSYVPVLKLFGAIVLVGIIFVSLFATGVMTSGSAEMAPTSTNSLTAYVNYVKTIEIPSPMPLDSTLWVTVSTSPHLGDYAVGVTGAGENWAVVSYSPYVYNYGVAVVGAKENIYIANSDTNGTASKNIFMRYNTVTDNWTTLFSGIGGSSIPQWFKNGTCMAWDNGNYIYSLFGGSYSDTSTKARHYFYRYSISDNTWTKLENTPDTGGQGAGDAITFVPGSALGVSDNYIFAIVGSSGHGTRSFWRYTISSNSWVSKALPPAGTDDGCSLVWTGGTYLYALRGEYIETSPLYDFWRYDIVNNTWESRAPIPAYPHDGGSGGVGDGGSLLWIGGSHSDYIYALSGNQCYPEPIWDNRFYLYTISTDSWARLENMPKGVGDQNGPRLGFASGKIYCWRGTYNDPPNGGENDKVLLAYSVDTSAPSAPTLISPDNNTYTNDNTPTFRWTEPETPENYTLVIDDDPNFGSPTQTITNITDNTYTLTSPLSDGTYYWHVRAIDGAGNVGVWSSIWQFTISQPPSEWYRTWTALPGENSEDWTSSVAVDGDYIYTGGSTWNTATGTIDFLLLKYDKSGNLVWENTWDNGNNDFGTAVAVGPCSVYVVGYTYRNNDYQGVILQYDKNGTLLWSQDWGGSGFDFFSDVVVINDDSVLVAGTTSSYGEGKYDAVVLSYSERGDLLEYVTWGGSGDDRGFGQGKLLAVLDDTVYLCGWTNSKEITGQTDVQAFLVKYTIYPALTKMWDTTWGGPNWDTATGVTGAVDYSIYVTGITETATQNYNGVLRKYTADGAFQWENTLDNSGRHDGFCGVTTLGDNVYVTGWTGAYGSTYRPDLILLKYNSSGTKLWQKNWGDTVLPNTYDAGDDVAIGSDGIYVAGCTSAPGTDVWDALLIKYNIDQADSNGDAKQPGQLSTSKHNLTTSNQVSYKIR